MTEPKETRSDTELLQLLSEASAALRTAVATTVVGQEAVIEAMLVTLVARGHALLVGVPGLAKTLLVSSLAEALHLSFGRVQFTPDLLPADITGTDILQEEVDPSGRLLRKLRFLPGPIFANLVLADEVNRTPPKTQAALLQAMQERKVTVGNVTHALPDPFQVFATRNPIEQEGTYSLPEAQLDRFLLEIHVSYPSESEEREIARRTTSGDKPQITPVMTADDLRAVSQLVPRVPATDEAVALAVRLARLSRPGERGAPKEVEEFVRFGAGPRGSQALVLAAKARAALRGEAVADVDDVRALLVPALRHRMVLSYRAEAEGISDEQVLAAVLKAARLRGHEGCSRRGALAPRRSGDASADAMPLVHPMDPAADGALAERLAESGGLAAAAVGPPEPRRARHREERRPQRGAREIGGGERVAHQVLAPLEPAVELGRRVAQARRHLRDAPRDAERTPQGGAEERRCELRQPAPRRVEIGERDAGERVERHEDVGVRARADGRADDVVEVPEQPLDLRARGLARRKQRHRRVMGREPQDVGRVVQHASAVDEHRHRA